MDSLRFGVELETVGISRGKLAEAIEQELGGTLNERHGNYAIIAPDGRVWTVVSDASLSGGLHRSGEVVSPILTWADIDTLQRVVRAVRRAGATVDGSTGLHIHVSSDRFDARSITNLVKIVHKNEQLIEHALGVTESRKSRYCRPIDPEFLRRLETHRPQTLEQLSLAWYGEPNTTPSRYHASRYHTINLNGYFVRKAIEIRAFAGSLHAGEVKAYVQLVLALAAKAISAKSTSSKRRVFNPATAKYDFRVLLLQLRMIGPEYKTARLHLTKNLAGSSAWKGERRDRRSRPQASAPSDPIASALAAA